MKNKVFNETTIQILIGDNNSNMIRVSVLMLETIIPMIWENRKLTIPLTKDSNIILTISVGKSIMILLVLNTLQKTVSVIWTSIRNNEIFSIN